ncbi:hypothetical protein M501DRAFT_934364 [Patellaria atrata CBS 101060]|uniref:Mitochondrial distribution and morphology protein 12 n=1 Tax=Patellaria atrata CBS 101060 TaxID=1346257 RepID=A0A9P4VN74_9PEZI|nr:hypothetical protein M501DRAFT_934364 [Patellaria atrata CBS 101060]
MSVDINWETLTDGPDGLALAETIRAFIHDKFQQVTLPRFIRSVKVHSFDFGKVAPQVELKDICDPLSDFYEDDEDVDNEAGISTTVEDDAAHERSAKSLRERRLQDQLQSKTPSRDGLGGPSLSNNLRPGPYIDTRLPGLRGTLLSADQLGSPILSRAPTPGIPGGTSNLNYFHLPLSAGISGTSTPLAAVAGAQFHNGWSEHHSHHPHHPIQTPDSAHLRYQSRPLNSLAPSIDDPSSRPTSQHQYEPSLRDPRLNLEEDPIHDENQNSPPSSPPLRMRERNPEDLQVVARVKYNGDVKLSLTAEILLDYPMPSFVGIPLKLNITGLSFDGVAILAYTKKRAHFCFLSPDDADALVGAESNSEPEVGGFGYRQPQEHLRSKPGGLLEEIRVESEIGQKENGKTVLKNVGKVEKFVLDQVRRLFEEEFVYPSFWTFLV